MITNTKIESIKTELVAAQAAAESYKNSNTEGGYGYNPHDDKVDALIAQLGDAEIDELIANVDTYKARWNAAVKKHSVNGQIRNIRAVEAEAGFTVLMMQAAKSRMTKN